MNRSGTSMFPRTSALSALFAGLFGAAMLGTTLRLTCIAAQHCVAAAELAASRYAFDSEAELDKLARVAPGAPDRIDGAIQ